MKWVTRERPKIDRIACPWLIARFIDKDPERNIFKRPIALISWIAIMVVIVLFTVASVINREFLD